MDAPEPSVMKGDARHLYLHVPFCRSICPYCDFAVTDRSPPAGRLWADALARELDLWEAAGVRLDRIETLLVGGGTPSRLGIAAMEDVRRKLGDRRSGAAFEWTVEANPEDVTREMLERWAEAGVTRVNLGVQSLDPSALEFLGRRHDPATATRAMSRLSASPVRSWGVDLLYGLPLELDPDPARSVGVVVEAGAPHVSIYELTAEPGTPLGARVAAGRVELADNNVRADQYLRLVDRLSDGGRAPYEMTAFAMPGHASEHALAMLYGGSWLGLGPAAHSRVGGQRSRNLRDWSGYLSSIDRGELPRVSNEPVSPDDARFETLWLHLRGAAGIESAGVPPAVRKLGREWVRAGFAFEDPERIRLTPEGWLRLDRLAMELARMEAENTTPSPGPRRVGPQ